jgi:membrane-associated protein
MHDFLDLLKDPNKFVQYIIAHGGLFLLMFIIFAETGLFAGFFLPGDSLLFVAGIYANELGASIGINNYFVVMLLVTIAAIIGNLVGYWFGFKSGDLLYKREDSFFFKKKHLQKAEAFYKEYGSKAIVMGRFIPFVRTFAPIVAGMVKMDFRTFVINTLVGAVAWVFGMMLAGKLIHGYVLEHYNYDLTKKIELIAIGIILLSISPIIFKVLKSKFTKP